MAALRPGTASCRIGRSQQADLGVPILLRFLCASQICVLCERRDMGFNISTEARSQYYLLRMYYFKSMKHRTSALAKWFSSIFQVNESVDAFIPLSNESSSMYESETFLQSRDYMCLQNVQKLYP